MLLWLLSCCCTASGARLLLLRGMLRLLGLLRLRARRRLQQAIQALKQPVGKQDSRQRGRMGAELTAHCCLLGANRNQGRKNAKPNTCHINRVGHANQVGRRAAPSPAGQLFGVHLAQKLNQVVRHLCA